MCGIAGIVLKDREAKVDEVVLGRMTDALRHRGPDGRGLVTFGNVGLGHRRLSVVDLEGGHQPMGNPEGTLWVTFNGELYNYVELRAELIARGCRLRTYSDTEVLLQLYACYGLKMFERMNGMFAFALYDVPRRRLLLARDRFGEKPLYVRQDHERLLFASEIKALWQAGVAAQADPAAIQEYLTFQHCLDDHTLFSGVRRLPPATYLLVDAHGEVLDERQYWNLEFEEDHTRDDEHWVEELRFLLEDAVKTRLRSDVPVGTYLSGGVDSSVVSCLAAKLMGRGLPAFTGWFAEGEAFTELQHAEAVARHNLSPHYAVCPTAEDFSARLHDVIYHLDEPAAGPGAFPQLLVSELAGRHVKVVLGGQGGDEIFGGYARYLLLYLEECLKGSIFQTQDSARHIVTLGNVLPNLSLLQQYVPLMKQFWSRGLFEPVERRYYSLVTRTPDLDRLFSRDFLAGRDEAAIYGAFARQFNAVEQRVSTGGSALFNRMTAYDMRTSLQALLQVEDRMSMAASVESRLPLLDHRIAELMFRMPPRLKYRDGRSKAVLLAAVRTLLPPSILNRRDKMGFPVPFVEWARGPLRGFVGDILLGPSARARGIYDVDGVRRLLADERPFGRELWGLLCLELWFQMFVDGPGTRTSGAVPAHP